MGINETSPNQLHDRQSLRIAVVTETYPPEINGVSLTLARVVRGLLQRGHLVQLVRPRQAASEQAASRPRFDEILVRGIRIPNYPALRAGLPAIRELTRAWTARRPDVVHVATEGPLGWSAITAAGRLGIPVTSDFHTNFDDYSRHYGLGALTRMVGAYLRRFHNRTALTLVPTSAQAAGLRCKGYHKVEVVGRGVDAKLFSPNKRSQRLRHSWGIDRDGLAVVHVGRLAREKNLELVFKAFEAIRVVRPDARLILVGDGPDRARLAASHRDYIFSGMRTGEDLAAHYASGDLFLFPSLTETYGNVTLEAMASGLALVAFNYAAAAEVITHGKNGLVVPYGEDLAFTRAAFQIAGNIPLRVRMGEAARKKAEELDWERICERYSNTLQIVANSRPSHQAILPFETTGQIRA
jgi:glycosyltransferase involved in cell wall biosynthesis